MDVEELDLLSKCCFMFHESSKLLLDYRNTRVAVADAQQDAVGAISFGDASEANDWHLDTHQKNKT